MQRKTVKRIIRYCRTLTWLSCVLVLCVGWIALDSWMHITDADEVRAVEIPNFCGMVAEKLEFEAWQEVSLTYRHDATIPAGVVLSQSPASGSRRKLSSPEDSCRIELVISLGEESVILPSLAGGDVREATETLRRLGLVPETKMQEGHAPRGEVLFMDPPAGRELPIGTTVTLTVSAGLPTETVQVPDTRGMTRADALIALWLARLEVGEVVEEVSDGTASGCVMRQSHRPGTTVRAGTSITLYIANESPKE